MKISWRLVALGIVAFLIFLVATLPAEMVLPRLQSRDISAAGVSGSIWNGRAGALQIGATSLGTTTWKLNPLRLFFGKLGGDIQFKRDDGSAQASIDVGFGGKVQIAALKGAVPIAAFGGVGLPGGWQGDIHLQISKLDLEKNWPTRAMGNIEVLNLLGPAYQPTALGNFRVEFADKPSANNELIGTLLSSGEGPLDVKGTLRLMPNRMYVIDAQVATQPSAPASITKALQYLGPPDAQGRRPLSLSGSL